MDQAREKQEAQSLKWPTPQEVAELDRQALNVALLALNRATEELHQRQGDGSLTLKDRKRLLRMRDTAHRMARRASEVVDASE